MLICRNQSKLLNAGASGLFSAFKKVNPPLLKQKCWFQAGSFGAYRMNFQMTVMDWLTVQ